MKCRILVVEDSATQAEALRALLEEHAYDVVVARSGEAALEQVAAGPFDMVLSDVVMGGMTGYDLCRHIKQDPQLRSLPVVLLTSLTDPMDIVRGLDCGADNYITKPYEAEHLLARVRHVLDNRRLRQGSKTSLGVSVRFLGRDLNITSDKEQILDLFISSVEDVVRTNEALRERERDLAEAHAQLEAYAQEKAREARASDVRYRALLQNASDAIFVLDTDRHIVEANERAAELLGRTAETLLHQPLVDMIAPDDREDLCARMAIVLEGDRITPTEGRFVDSHGNEIWCELSASLTEVGNETLVLLVARDAMERRRADAALREQEAAERANRAKSEFISRMSHELRTPLNAILGFGQLLEADVEKEEDRESVEQILKAGQHLLDLIDEVLDLAKIEAGRLSLTLEPVSVHAVVRESMDLVRPMAEQRGITVRMQEGLTSGSFLRADRQRLKQVMLNLFSNAIKYNREGGMVAISCNEIADDRLRIAVRDTGYGIPSARRKRLFTPFERLGAEQTGVTGTGLGLALSRNLVEAMDGELGVESVEQKGSTFWVDLPMAARPESAESAHEPRPSNSQPPSGEPSRTVLFVEDNLANVRLLERVLQRKGGINLITAMQGRLGLELAREHRPDVILLDLNLPDLSGDEILEQLQEDPQLQEIPVIMVSGDAVPAQAKRLLAMGAQAYLTKPFQIKHFLSVLDDVLQSRPS